MNDKSQSLNDVVQDLEQSVPAISENVVKESQGGEGEGQPVASKPESPSSLPFSAFHDETLIKDLRDKYGRSFDPKLHVTDSSGFPIKNHGKEHYGKLKIRPGVKAPGPEGESVLNVPPEPDGRISEEPQAQEEPQEQKAPLSPEVAGKIAARYTQHIGVMLFGEEWYFIKDKGLGMDEEREISEAYGYYFEQKGVKDISPGWLLLIVLMNYSLLRFRMPKTQKRFSGLKYKIISFYYWLKGKKYYGARPYLGNDREWQDDSGKSDLSRADNQKVENPGPGPAKRSGLGKFFSGN